jgi:hypothetical protein
MVIKPGMHNTTLSYCKCRERRKFNMQIPVLREGSSIPGIEVELM